jgi:CTP synthase
METRKYVFVTGGVVSGLGKGVTASSLGRLLKARGFRVTIQKFDPYLNLDPGTMNPCQHGEVFVTEDGAETDLDLGHYERFIDESLTRNSNVTTGQVYLSIIKRERAGGYAGRTVQVIPHVTEEIKSRIVKSPPEPGERCVTIIEVGGTVGDIESQPFLEAIRQFQHEVGHSNATIVHLTLIPYLKASQEMKTKPTQASVKQLQMLGLWPDVIVCRSEHPIDQSVSDKIALFCNVPSHHVIPNLDVDFLYEAPLALEERRLAHVVMECWGIEAPEPDLDDWRRCVDVLRGPRTQVTIALVGKYLALHDSYISVVEALNHGGIAHRASIRIDWVDSEEVTPENVEQKLGGANSVLVPGGFGDRGIDGMIHSITFARTRRIPFLGICLGMQLAVVEFARSILRYTDAHSQEFDPHTQHPVIGLMPEQVGVTCIGGTLRRGACPCKLAPGSKSRALYGTDDISERHRHRYEVNNEFRQQLEANGMALAGMSPDGRIVEMVEIPDHPFFIGTQAHPEFKSRPNRPHPLFAGLVGAALATL